MTKILEKKVAIVTGAASGIGRAIAYELGAEGARVVLSDVNDAGGRETHAQLRDRGVDAIYVHADTSSPADHDALVAAALRSFGRLDVAVNNAGISGPLAPVGDYPIEGWDKVIAVNLSGVFYGMRAQIPAMLAHGAGGSIINITSILGQVGFRNAAAYVSAKHGLVGLTQTAALEYGPQKIRVNAVAPGFIRTPMVDDALPPEALQVLASMHALGRIGEPAEVAALVTWLASDQASFATGGCYPIDGGYLAQ
jgi:NAD(P)-dependent dehydrogenase (short-subunit alcohol dehydrogenase family)